MKLLLHTTDVQHTHKRLLFSGSVQVGVTESQAPVELRKTNLISEFRSSLNNCSDPADLKESEAHCVSGSEVPSLVERVILRPGPSVLEVRLNCLAEMHVGDAE